MGTASLGGVAVLARHVLLTEGHSFAALRARRGQGARGSARRAISTTPTTTTDLTTSPTTSDSSTITSSSSTIPTTTTTSTSSSPTTTTKPTSKTTAVPTTPTSTPASTSTTTSPPTSTSTTQPTTSSGMSHASQIAIGVIVPVVVILLVGALWFLMFRRPNPDRSRGRSRTHRRWGTGTSLGIWTGGSGSRDATPPPAYSKDAAAAGQASGNESNAQLSMHEQYLRDAGVGEGIVAAGEREERARGRERSRESREILQQGGYELMDLDLRGAVGPDRGGPGVAARAGSGSRSRAGDVSPLSGSSGRSSPHPGDQVVL
ncbi:hypothetical protein B0J18DRAFT_483578 [Chaetomium sp. MPI-SDFR-AT-0129]|nr:hypothetical protein B0J18DRAFT_483578 [Chaetomium sp. MPI-SDFR-AT-0129]